VTNEERLAQVEVSSETVQAVIDGFGAFTLLASRFLAEAGLGRATVDGSVNVVPGVFAPLPKLLRALKAIEADFGERLLTGIGEGLARRRGFDVPPRGIEAALAGVSRLHHAHHRLAAGGVAAAGKGGLAERIGHYAPRFADHQNLALVTVDAPTPCACDRGWLLAISRQFERSAELSHEPGACRAKGGASCTYRITWPAG
jgi:hypothetical protein